MIQEVFRNKSAGREGSVQLELLFVFIMIAALGFGGQKLYTALANRKPTVMSYSEYVRTKPSAKWLVLTNCQLDLPNGCISHESGDINGKWNEYYVPVLNPDAPKEQAYVLYKTTDATIFRPLKEMEGLKTDEEVKAWVKNNFDRVYPRRNVSGLVAFGLDSNDNVRDLKELEKDMPENFIVLDANAQPTLAAGIGYTGAGLAMFCGMAFYIRRKRS